MATYIHADRPIKVTTPLGKDALLLVGFTGHESISQLFSFHLDLLAENKQDVAFDKLLGKSVTISLALSDGKERYFNGICSRVMQGVRDHTFTTYQMEIVPQFWLLTRRAQSRIFQHISIPDILKEVFKGLNVAYEIQGTFQSRDFCVQYRETDFNFASRLMEEEGIYYFFKHTAEGHQMVVANTPLSHPDMPGPTKIIYEELEGGTREEQRIYDWQKVQELRSGKYTLWDHCFELPHKPLEAEEPILESVQVGEQTHKLKVGDNDRLEIYDYPGAYAQRFDGVDRSGGDQAGELQKIYQDNRRTTKIRMEQETVPGIVISGQSDCRQFVSGHKFSLERHFNADGQYLLTSIQHAAQSSSDYRSGEDGGFTYENSFTCIPFALPFRPPRITPRPIVQGTQTAVVVGPAGEEIFTDKYGRVKVQFHWDRQGKHDADSSCWIRVGTLWAGKQWGVVHIPRIGQEVIVDFLEGDPDQPIIVGSVFNADTMPPYELPKFKTYSGIKSNTSPDNAGFNEIRFEDKKGEEQIFIHAERDYHIRVKKERREWVEEDRSLIVKRDKMESVEQDKSVKVNRDVKEEIGRDYNQKVGGKAAIEIGTSLSLKVGTNVGEKFGANHSEEVGANYSLKAGAQVVIEASAITLKVGGNSVNINPAGVQIIGSIVLINSGGAALSGMAPSIVAPVAAAVAKEAVDAKPGSMVFYQADGKGDKGGGQDGGDSAPQHDPNSEENKEKTSWIEIVLVDEADKPIAGEAYTVKTPDDKEYSGTLDDKGFARVDHIDPGSCKVTFPNLDKGAWEDA